MTNEEKIKYLNDFFDQGKNFTYHGPKTLFKYRSFDNFSFDMLENDYVYLCPAEKLDDPTECDVSFDLQDYYDIENDGLKKQCVEQIIGFVKPYTNKDNYDIFNKIINHAISKDGTVKRNILIDLYPEFKEYIPEEYAAPMVNWLANIPQKLDEPEIKSQIKNLLSTGYNAKKETGICSLCESNSVSDMWKGYADNYSGYCIEYDVSNYTFNSGLFPVVYQEERETNIVLQILGNFIGQMITNFSNGEIDADKTQFMRLFLTKYKKWEYQKEWRLLGEAGEKFPAPKIKAVYLGKNCSEDNKVKMKKFSESKGFKLILKK